MKAQRVFSSSVAVVLTSLLYGGIATASPQGPGQQPQLTNGSQGEVSTAAQQNFPEVDNTPSMDASEGAPQEVSADNEINPFRSTSQSLEDIQMQQRIADAKLSLAESNLELSQREFEQEMLPYRQAMQKQELTSQLSEARAQERQEEMQRRQQMMMENGYVSSEEMNQRINDASNNILRQQNQRIDEMRGMGGNASSMSEDEIQQRIEQASESILNQRNQRIAELEDQVEQQRSEQREKENTFSLKLIASRDNGAPYATISNENEDFSVQTGSEFNGWRVVNIDRGLGTVTITRGGQTKTVRPSEGDGISMISKSSGGTQMSSGGAVNVSNDDMSGMPMPPNLPGM